MKLVTLPLVVSIAFIGFEHRSEIADLYRAAYPTDPVKREALEECARTRPNFNRLDTIDRDSCYAGLSLSFFIDQAPGSGGYYGHSLSVPPGTDIRGQEATGTDRQSAQAAPQAPAVAKSRYATRR
jgi:hypothetical protein